MSESLRVAVLGPKGQCGSCVVDELLSRGHSVVGISRSPPKTWPKSGEYGGIPCDFSDIRGLSKILSDGGFDAVVSAFAPPLTDFDAVYTVGVEGHGNIKMAILRSTYRGPFIIIGGAGSLYYKNGVQLCDDESFAFKHWYAWPDVHLDYMSTRIPFANWFLRSAKTKLTDPGPLGLIFCSRAALTMWEGVLETKWSFLSPPWQLRDKGIRTGKYEIHVDNAAGSAEHGIDNGIYNEDMAVAIVDEVENNKLNHKHWTCTGPIGLKEW
ncbi:hypothetical protein N7507_003275 [Penicillium longicatenatum]|nr:hypothetical protein N7507_003275 [Penicillium longicatenatum]